MQDSVRNPPEPSTRQTSGTVKGMTTATVTALVVVTAYSVVIGGSGLAWFAWIVLGLLTLALVTAEGS